MCNGFKTPGRMSARKRQTSIPVTGSAIFAVRDAWKLTQDAFARVLGRTREWVARTESREANMIQRGTLEKIASAMGKTPDEALHILRMVDFETYVPDAKKVAGPVQIPPMKKPLPDDPGRIIRDGLSEIPFFDLSLAAGQWSDVQDIPEICGPGSISQGLFRVRLSGDSMNPRYKSGMIVEFECLRYGVDDMAIGRDYYIQKDDGSATFKRLEKATEHELTLRALNKKKYPNAMIVERQMIVRMAVARGEYKPFL